MLVKVELCPSCADKLHTIAESRGEDAMSRAVGPTLQACTTCRAQLPERPGKMVTRMSGHSPVLSLDQVDLLLALSAPGTTSSSMRALGGKEKRLANTLCKRGLAQVYGGAGAGKLYFTRTQAGEELARVIVSER